MGIIPILLMGTQRLPDMQDLPQSPNRWSGSNWSHSTSILFLFPQKLSPYPKHPSPKPGPPLPSLTASGQVMCLLGP